MKEDGTCHGSFLEDNVGAKSKRVLSREHYLGDRLGGSGGP